MKDLKYSDILGLNRDLAKKIQGAEYNIGIVSNITVNQIKEIFEYSLRSEGVNAQISLGNYDNIVQETKQFASNNLVVIFWELANIVDGLQYKASLFDDETIAQLLEKVKGEMKFVFENLKGTSRVLFNSFSSLVFNHHNLEKDKFDYLADELNQFLNANKPDNFSIINIERIIAGLSVERSVDFRYFYSSKALYSIDFYKNWSTYVLPIVRALNGKTKKALILDCDNTLWKGVLGEEGFDGILLSANQPGGAAFEEVQSLAKSLTSEGVVLGLCSKNNAADVEKVIATHPKMTLQDQDLTIKKVNWTDKVTNLQSIAKSLNIGLDSLVFVDDSSFEIEFVKNSLPQVKTIQVPRMISEYPNKIRENLGLFYRLSKTAEDSKRVKMYREQVQRDEAKVGFENLEAYIKSLEINLRVYRNDETIIARLSQMTQKTNQFNLTTKRYSESDIKHFVESDDYEVIAIGVSDKFGDNGITGLAIVEVEGVKANIDTLLMSCRIIGRNIEYRFIDYIVETLDSRGVKEITSDYFKTLKNSQVADFYNKLGFNLQEEIENNKHYSIASDTYQSHAIDYMQIEHGR